MKPEYTLHPTKEGFIVTSNEQFKIGDINVPSDVISINEFSNTSFEDLEVVNNKNNGYKKVIAQQDQLDFSEVPEERQREIGYFDVEKFANNCDKSNCRNFKREHTLTETYEGIIDGFKIGFQKHAKLTSDRRFTEEHIRKAIHFGIDRCHYGLSHETPSKHTIINEYIQSLSNQSWPVEIEFTDGKVKILEICR